jgi:hypothetical protein
MGMCLLMALASTGWAQTQREPPQKSGGADKLEDFARDIGPLKVKGQNFTVVLHGKRIRRPGFPVDADFGETVARMEIRDQAGKVHFEKTFPYEVSEGRFVETTAVWAQVLEGKDGVGLLITYGVLPSPPLAGESWQVFGLFSGPTGSTLNGKLVPFSRPIFADGQLIDGQPGEPIMKTSQEPRLQGDVLHFRVWTGNVFAIFPVRILWFRNSIGPAWHCEKMTPRGWRPICQFRIEAQRVAQQDELTFVRLYPEADEGMGVAEHVVLRKNSRVEFLAAEAEQLWREEAKAIEMGVTGDLWLKVRIDGKQGWIHTQEDFQAIGLPQAG